MRLVKVYGRGGRGLGAGGARRHRNPLRDNIQGITKPAIRRLARRGGVKRISGLIYEETRGVLKVFLENVIRDAVTYTEHARRKTVTAMDVVYALQRQGRTLYGFGGPHGPPPVPTKRRRPPRIDTSFPPAAPFVDIARQIHVDHDNDNGGGPATIVLTYEQARRMFDAPNDPSLDTDDNRILDFVQRDPCQIANSLMKIYAGYLVRNHARIQARPTESERREEFFDILGTAIYNNNVRTPSAAHVEFSTLMTSQNVHGRIGPPARINVDFRVENETYVIGRMIGKGAYGIVHHLLTPFAGVSFAQNINSSVNAAQNVAMSDAQKLGRGMWIQEMTFNVFPYKTITVMVHGVARPTEQVEVKLGPGVDFASVTPGSSMPWRFLQRLSATQVRIQRMEPAANAALAAPANAAPPTDAEIAQAFALHAVEWVDPEETTLRGTSATDVDALGAFLDRMGVEQLTLLMPDRRYVYKRSEDAARVLNCTQQRDIAAYNMRKRRTLTCISREQAHGAAQPVLGARYTVQSTAIELIPGVIDLTNLNLTRADGPAGNVAYQRLRLLDTTTPRVLKNFYDYERSTDEKRRSRCAEMYVETLVQSTLFCALRGTDRRIQNKTPFSTPTREKVAKPTFLTKLNPRSAVERRLCETYPPPAPGKPPDYYLYQGPAFAMDGAGQMVRDVLRERSTSTDEREREFKFFFWRALKLIYRLQSRMRFVHGDLHCGNILYDGRSFLPAPPSPPQPSPTLTLIDCGYTYCRLPEVAADGNLRTNVPEYTGTVIRVSNKSVPRFVPSFDPIKMLLVEWLTSLGARPHPRYHTYVAGKVRDFMNRLPRDTRNVMAMGVYGHPSRYPASIQAWTAPPHGRDLTPAEIVSIGGGQSWYNSILLFRPGTDESTCTQEKLDPDHRFTCARLLNELTRELYPTANFREVAAIPL